jgi:serine O-acetyltransferase
MKRGRGAKRHPTVEDHVVIGTGATLLGPITIGTRSKIGAQALVLESLPADSLALGHAGSIIQRCRSRHRCATADASRAHHTLLTRY